MQNVLSADFLLARREIISLLQTGALSYVTRQFSETKSVIYETYEAGLASVIFQHWVSFQLLQFACIPSSVYH
jgi:hypothetical protein